MRGQVITKTKENITNEGVNNSNVKLIPKDTTLLSFKLSIGKTAIAGKDLYTNEAIAGLVPFDKNEISNNYLYQLFSSKQINLENIGYKTFGKSLNSKFLKEEVKIPLPLKIIQEKIVSECETIDQATQQAQQTIDKAKNEIEEQVTAKQQKYEKLDEIVAKISKTVDPNLKSGKVNYIGLENIESKTGKQIGNINDDYSKIKSNKTIFQKGDILYGKLRPNLNKVYKTEINGICSTDILVFRIKNNRLIDFYKYYFLSKKFNNQVLTTVSGQQLPRTSWTKINSFPIPVPPLSEQKTLVAQIEKLEQTINQAQQIINQAPQQKQQILDKYLK